MASYQDVLNRAQGVAATPYTPYTGELVAGVNPQQTTGISGINDYAYSAQPAIQQAEGMATAAASPITAAQIQQYESPYTQDVVNRTAAQFANQNAQQMQGVKGNAIAQGALGGNREAVAEAETANQQQLAQAPVIAGLMNQGYTTGLNTALTEQQALASGANQLGNLGVAGQGAGLSGAGAQVGAGSLEQGTQQALDAALLQQFQTAQAFPYQQTQWLAGIDNATGSQMGGTGTTTAPAPSMLSQLGGLATAGVGMLGGTGAFGASGYLNPASAAFMFSDRRVKENIKKIGKLFDGQTIYRYNYKGDPTTRIGLIAQNVERHHPDAVREIGGIKAVNYDDATKDAIRRWRGGGVANFDTGGGVTEGVAGSPYGLSGMPFAGAHGYIPAGGNIAHGRGNMPSAPNVGQPQDTAAQLGQQIGSMAKAISGGMSKSAGVNPTVSGYTNVEGLNYGPNGAPIVTPAAGVNGPVGESSGGRVGGYASGGVANLPMPRGYAEGGSPDWGAIDPEAFSPDVVGNPGFATADLGVVPTKDGPLPVVDSPAIVPAAGGDDTHFSVPRGRAVPAYEADRWAAAHPATFAAGVQKVNPDGTFSGPAPFGYGPGTALGDVPNYDGVVASREAPVRAASGVAGDDALPAASQPASGVVPTTVASNGVDWSGSGKLWPALAAAGFGMMASKSPFPGVAVGEGGISGMQTYAAERQQENQQALKKSELDLEVKKLAQQADIAQKHLELSTKPYSEMTVKDKAQLEESKRQHDAQIAHQNATAAEAQRMHDIQMKRIEAQIEQGNYSATPGKGPNPETGETVDGSWLLNKKTGDNKFVPGYIQTAKSAAPTAATPDDVARREVASRRLIKGDLSALTNVGRGAQGDAELKGINGGAVQILTDPKGEYKYTPQQAADYLAEAGQNFKSQGAGKMTEAKTAAQRETNLNLILKAADAAIPAALEASEKVARTGWVPINSLIQRGEVIASNPELKEFGMANLQLAEHWARAMNPTGVMRESDRDKALSFLSTADSPETYRRAVMQLQKQVTRERDAIRSTRGESAPPSATVAPAASSATPVTVKQNGHTYQRQSDGSYKAID